MASQNVKINLLFDAQTTQAQKNIQQLGNLLHQISSKTTVGIDSGSLSEAVNAAQQLQIHLQNAVNVDTGKLDLMKLNSNLKASGKSLQDYANSLTKIGPTGEQAFLRLAQAVSAAEVPVVKTNKVIKDFLQTLANTAKWQVASSAIHGIQGMLNSAVGHAKDLNKALTDIQIVTNYSTNYMSNFAEAAAKAAKELHTTTTEYAKAALIFYQQGLSGSAVEERASVVVKLSQVTGQSAQEVSDQMTAIWNNFDNGSKSLEYYADVLTKLGAATAASTDEISDGLEKFAAVAETVGLSYEYAAASVATVVDKTRQSADVVGTAFKTIFARMQGLSLGETLEDGVDLNKYSQALEKVGVDVLTADGNLREMDDILDDLGAKWDGLGESTQIALAQTVGGVRQYNQMMALMNNWEDVHKNIDLAAKSTGELATQQKIWSASYEASVTKLEQAKNELYENFISDDLLIDFNDALTQTIRGVTDFIDRLGGIGPTILVLAGIFSKTLFPLIGNGFKKIGNTISVWTGQAAKDVANMQQQMSNQMSEYIKNGSLTEGMREQMMLSQQLLKEKQKLMLNSKNMTEAERAEAEAKLALAEAMAAETSQLLARKDALEKNIAANEKNLLSNKEAAADLGTGYAIQKYSQQRAENAPTDKKAQADYDAYTQEVINGSQTQTIRQMSESRNTKQEELNKLESSGSIEDKQIELEQTSMAIAEADSQGDEARATQLRIQEETLSREIEQQKALEKQIQLLEDQLALRRQINKSQVSEEDQKKGHVVGGAITSTAGNDDPEEGSRDTASSRLHADDTLGAETRASAETGRMQQIETSFGAGEASFDLSTQTMAIEASIANYEKLYATIGEQKTIQAELSASITDIGNIMADTSKKSQSLVDAEDKLTKASKGLSNSDKQRLASIKKFSPAYATLTKAEKDYVKALSDVQKEEKKQVSSNQASIKALKNAKDQYLDLARKAGLTEDALTELAKEFDNLDDAADNSATLGNIQNHFGQLSEASGAVGNDLQAMADNMATALVDGGQLSEEAVGELTTNLQALSNTTPQVNASMQSTQTALSGMSISAETVFSKLTTGVSTIVATGTSLFALQTAIGGLTQAFGEGGTAADKFQAIMSVMMTSLPLLTGMTKLFTAEKRNEIAATIASIPAKMAEMGLISAETAAKWALAAANIAALLTNPFTMALAAVAVAAIIVTLAVLNKQRKETEALTDSNIKLTEAQKEQASATAEQAKESAKLVDAWIDQMHAMDGLIAKYKELEAAEKDSAEAAKDIVEAVPDMVEAYNELAESAGLSDDSKYNDLIAKLERAGESNDVKAIEEITHELDKMMADANKDALDNGITSTKSMIISDIFTEANVTAASTSGRNILKDNASGVFIEELDDTSVIKGMSDAAGLTASWTGGEKNGIKDNWTGFGLRTDTEANFIEDYEKMLQLYNDAQQKFDASTLADDKGFQALKRIIEATEGTYNDYKGLVDTKLDASIASASLGLGDPDSLNKYSDYTTHKKAVFDQVKKENSGMSDDKIWAALDKYFADNGATNIYSKIENLLKTLKENGADTTAIEEYLNSLSPDQQKLFLEIDINKYQSKEAVQYAIEAAQIEADKQKIEVNIEGINNIEGSLKEDMDATAWQNIADEWANIQKSGIEDLMSFDEFLTMTYEEQSAYLDKIKIKQQELLVAKSAEAVAQAQKQPDIIANQYNADIEAKKAEIAATESSISKYKDSNVKMLGLLSQPGQAGQNYAAYHQTIAGNNNMISNQETLLAEQRAELAALEAEAIEAQTAAQEDLVAAEQELAIQMEVLDNMEIEAKGLNPAEVKEYADHLQDIAVQSDLVSDELKDNEDAAKKVAASVSRMNKGVEALSENFEEWHDILVNSDESSQEYSEALSDLRSAMTDLLDVDSAFVSSEFLTNTANMELMKKAAEGDAAAIDALRVALAEDIICQILVVDNFSDVSTEIQNLHNQIVGFDASIEVGATLETGEMDAAMQGIVDAAGMTVEQAQAYFNSLGYEPEFVMQNEVRTAPMYGKKVYTDEPVMDTVQVGDSEYPYIKEMTTHEEQVYMGEQEQNFVVPAMSAEGTPQIKSLTKTSSGKMNNSSSVNTGGKKSGGGSEPKKTKKTRKADVVDRYKEINDQIDDVRDAMEDAQRAADGLWGAARLKKMKEVQASMEKELQLMRQRRKEAAQHLEDDKANLQQVAQENNIAAFTFDDKGNISNYDEIMNGLYAQLKAAEDAAGETTDEAEQKVIDGVQERIDAIKEAIGIYDDTREELEEFDNEIDEWVRNIQEEKLNELNLQLEMEIMIDDAQLKKIEYYLGKTKEDIWGMAEAAALMTGQGKDLFNIDLGQAEVWTDKFADFQKQYDDLLYAYTHINPATGETFINQEQFVKALEELQGQIYDNLNNINELDTTMVSYYGETLAAAAEELSKFTDMMDHHVEVLDHYSSLLEIMGKSKDWARMKTVLQTQVAVAENAAEVSKANYKMLETELLEKQAAYDALDPKDDSYEAQVIRQQWLDAKNAANEAQLQMLEDAEAWAEALKALLETELEELGENLEKALAGDFGTLDYMMTSMERANSLQEEYLTTTNKIYETNKLMRTAQQEIDKTSNTVAKRRMAQFIEETQQMQNQNKLSQYELEIQQAKYDLLLAEIALEEAQSAKSTVRLQRDSEGNFGYVYTADQNEVANAQQQLEDAQNALYNIGLEGANKYAEQYAQTIQEMNDAVRELTEQWQNGEIASKEEYQEKMIELENHYGEKLRQFSQLHSIAIQTDSRVANDAWTRNFAHMTTQTGTWMNAVIEYVESVSGTFDEYELEIAKVEEHAGADLLSLQTKTAAIKTENENLVTSITDPDKGLLNAMQQEIDKVSEITLKYAEWRDTIQGVIDKQEELAKKINADIENESDDDESNDRKPETEAETETTGQTPPQSESNGSSGDDGTPSYKKGILSWTGNGSARIWTDSAGKTYSATSAEGRAIQAAFNRAYGANGGYKGDYFVDWNRLNADVLHEKYGLSTGGYTGDWSGSFGKLAFLHQKELVLNKQDTENLLAAMEFLNRITSAIDLQAMNNSLGGLLSSPSLGHVGDESGILEQQVHIEASFPGISDRNELEEAFNNLINQAAQYANRK